MTDETRWMRVRELFESLIDVDAALVERQLADVRRDDPALAGEVASLLQHHASAGAFLCEPAMIDIEEDRGLAPGTRLGTFRIEQEQGRGGMGRVYLATDTRLGRRVCLKVLAPELVMIPALREQLRREAQLCASISHPGICAVHALEEIDGTVAIVTEYVEGRTLRDEIAAGPMSPSTLAATVEELAAALTAAHARGIIHGDLKPENVMRSVDGHVKILDFGLGRVTSEGTPGRLSEVLAGTLTYMAPEQIDGRPGDARSDIFALGIVLYECATGTHPFAARTTLATTARILEHEAAPIAERRADLSDVVCSAIDQCLRKAPEERFPSAVALLASLGSGAVARSPRRGVNWWALHQVIAVALYLVACVTAWIVKEATALPATRWMFVAIGVLAAVAGILRGHLLFTARMHIARLRAERIRARRALVLGDVLIAVLLFSGAATLVEARPVATVLAMALAVGIAAAVLVIEPATEAGAFADPAR